MSAEKRVAVFGIDGADPAVVDRLLKKGNLPNLSDFISNGKLSKLETVNASQSPVAWASFMTGMNPGKHGVIDFIIRNPKTMQLQLGLNSERAGENGVLYSRILQEKPVWENLDGYDSSALFIPSSFPPVEFDGRMLCGMGIPDVRGTQGVSTIYMQNPNKERQEIVKLEFNSSKATTHLFGPGEIQVDFNVKISKEGLEFDFNKKKASVKEGNWSEWIELELDSNFKKIPSCFRIKVLNSKKGEIKFYLSPIIFSPKNPSISVSFPPEFSKEIYGQVGNYKPVSFESDVFGLKEELIDEDTWLEDMYYTMQTRAKTANYVLQNKKWNFFAINLFGVDRTQHLFYRYIDKKHPIYEDSHYAEEIDKSYMKADEHLGMFMSSLKEDDLAFVISDHGFGSYRQNVHVNKILYEEGFLKLNDENTSNHIGDIDFSKTIGYCVGFGSIYINLEGREKYGIVSEKDFQDEKQKIIEALKNYKFDGKKVFSDALDAEPIYSRANNLPDILPIFPLGLRASKQTTLGAFPVNAPALEDNLNKWSGDHIGPHLLTENPGIIASKQPLGLKDSSIMDLAPTAIENFKKPMNEKFDGKSLL